jgi:hypothetical protein
MHVDTEFALAAYVRSDKLSLFLIKQGDDLFISRNIKALAAETGTMIRRLQIIFGPLLSVDLQFEATGRLAPPAQARRGSLLVLTNACFHGPGRELVPVSYVGHAVWVRPCRDRYL